MIVFRKWLFPLLMSIFFMAMIGCSARDDLNEVTIHVDIQRVGSVPGQGTEQFQVIIDDPDRRITNVTALITRITNPFSGQQIHRHFSIPCGSLYQCSKIIENVTNNITTRYHVSLEIQSHGSILPLDLNARNIDFFPINMLCNFDDCLNYSHLSNQPLEFRLGGDIRGYGDQLALIVRRYNAQQDRLSFESFNGFEEVQREFYPRFFENLTSSVNFKLTASLFGNLEFSGLDGDLPFLRTPSTYFSGSYTVEETIQVTE